LHAHRAYEVFKHVLQGENTQYLASLNQAFSQQIYPQKSLSHHSGVLLNSPKEYGKLLSATIFFAIFLFIYEIIYLF